MRINITFTFKKKPDPNEYIQVPFIKVYFGWPVYLINPAVVTKQTEYIGGISQLPHNQLVWALRKHTRLSEEN